MNGDLEEMVQKDKERFRDLSGGDGMDLSPPALIELVFLLLTGMTLIAWFVSLFLFDVDGQTWMGIGALGLVMFGLPAGLVFALRRGGAEVVESIIRDVTR